MLLIFHSLPRNSNATELTLLAVALLLLGEQQDKEQPRSQAAQRLRGTDCCKGQRWKYSVFLADGIAVNFPILMTAVSLIHPYWLSVSSIFSLFASTSFSPLGFFHVYNAAPFPCHPSKAGAHGAMARHCHAAIPLPAAVALSSLLQQCITPCQTPC